MRGLVAVVAVLCVAVAVPRPSAASPAAGLGAVQPRAVSRAELAVEAVRTTGDLPRSVQDAVASAAGVVAVSAVTADQLEVPVGDGRVVGFDVIGIDPATYTPLLPASAAAPFGALRPGEVLLGETSAALRGLGGGDRLVLAGADLIVAGVVEDGLVDAAEGVLHVTTARQLGAGRVRYLLAGHAPGDAAAVEGIAAAVEAVPRTLVRGIGRAPWGIGWREVLPQSRLKAAFGEFAYRDGAGRGIVQDPGWADAMLVTAQVPLLGEVRCHRAVIAPLRTALGELEADGLGHLVDPSDYAGCHSARRIAAGAPVSRHAWGIAVDLNASANPFGAPGRQDPRLVAVMERHGFGYGGRWPTPDGMHFEYRGE